MLQVLAGGTWKLWNVTGGGRKEAGESQGKKASGSSQTSTHQTDGGFGFQRNYAHGVSGK